MLDLKKFTHGGITVWVRPKGDYRMWDEGIVKETQAQYLWDQFDARQVTTAIDLGAHIGSWSRYLRHLNPDCQIVCVEADGENATICNLNHYGDRKVYRYHAACRYDEGPVVLVHNDTHSGSHKVVPADAAGVFEANPERDIVPIARKLRLEEIINIHQWKQVDLLKIDVEGSELDIFQRCPGSVLDKIQLIVGEHHGRYEAFDQLCGKRLREHGFHITYVPHPVDEVDDLGMFLCERKDSGNALLRQFL